MSARHEVLWSNLLELRRDDTMSLQAQIRRAIVAAIRSGRLSAHAPVPSSRILCEHLHVARNTVMLAYQQLTDEGYLYTKPRAGCFVSPGLAVEETATGSEPADDAAIEWSARLRILPHGQRNIIKPSNWTTCRYPFIYGQFDADTFPLNAWRECCIQAMRVLEVRGWAQDLITRDDPTLIEEVRTKILPLRGVWAKPDEILMTTGAQQALYMIADLLVNERVRVGVEDPGYPDARNTFMLRAGEVRPLPVDEGGLRIDDGLIGCDYVYATPSHQSPTTVTMPMDRRIALLEAASRHDIVIVEDDYETETSFAGPPNPALKSLDRTGRVIYVGSLSKSIAPGLRLGFIVASAELITHLRALRRLMVRHPSSLIQRAFALFLQLGYFNSLMREIAVVHRDRAQVLQQALRDHIPAVDFVPVGGGASCWVSGPSWLDAQRLAREAFERGVMLEPGDVHFLAQPAPMNHFRLGFSSIPAGRIVPGIQALAPLVEAQRPS